MIVPFLQSGILAGDTLIEPVKNVELPEIIHNDFSEKGEVSRTRHVVYKTEKQWGPPASIEGKAHDILAVELV